MKKISKGGLVLAMLMAGNAHAAFVNVNLTGQVDYVYGYGNNSVNQGDAANFNLTFDTSAAPSYSYNYSWPGYYSVSENVYNNGINYSGNVGSFAFSGNLSGNNGDAWAYNENFYGTNYSGAGFYTYASTGSSWQELEVYSSGNNPIDLQNLATAFLSGNGLYFYLYDVTYGNSGYSFSEATGTFNNATLSAAGPSAVPVPAAVWLFGSGLMGLLGFTKKKATLSALPA